jgi:hypothetical protein
LVAADERVDEFVAGAAAEVFGEVFIEQGVERLPATAAVEQVALERVLTHLLQQRAEERRGDELAAGIRERAGGAGAGKAAKRLAARGSRKGLSCGTRHRVSDAAVIPQGAAHEVRSLLPSRLLRARLAYFSINFACNFPVL